MTAGGSDFEPDPERGNLRLNLVLYGILLLGVVAAVLGGFAMREKYDADGGDMAGGWWDRTTNVLLDRRPEVGGSRAGDYVGTAQISAVSLADAAEQERTAAVLDSATQMANALLNINYKNVQATVSKVRSLATGTFLSQYEKSEHGVATAARRAKAVQTSKVVWTGLVGSDPDSATVIVASTGTVANKVTHYKPVSRTYRLQLDLVQQDGKWLTRDLQFVQ